MTRPPGESEWQPDRWYNLRNATLALLFWTATIVILCAMAWR